MHHLVTNLAFNLYNGWGFDNSQDMTPVELFKDEEELDKLRQENAQLRNKLESIKTVL